MKPIAVFVLLVSCLSLCTIISSVKTTSQYKLAGYFANWAQYHGGQYVYYPSDLAPIINNLDYINYAFAKFDPTTFEVQPYEPDDAQYYSQILAYKNQNPQLKLILSIGGWNFASQYFSWMVGSSANRTAFITSLLSYLQQYSLDGVDLDWEYPCSPPRTDYVFMQCWNIVPLYDGGGNCPADKDNFLAFIQELRAKAPNIWISIAGQAARSKYQYFHLKEISALIDMWHIMTYDYSVSETTTSNLTAPNCPLYNPGSFGQAGHWSVNTTIQGYLESGVPPSKIMVGAALYGHTWYIGAGQPNNVWQKYDVQGLLQKECCGIFATTYGTKEGVGSRQCGTLMISEIEAKLGSLDSAYLEPKSQTMIGYDSTDGVWITFDNAQSYTEKAEYVKSNNLAGIFIFDTSMDTMSNGQFTYQMTKVIYNALN